MSTWRGILDGIKQSNIWNFPHDWRKIWYLEAYVEHEDEDLPDTLIRALAFQKVLQNTPVVVISGDLLCGNCQGFVRLDLPDGYDEQHYNQVINGYNFIGHRDFQSGFDHTLADYPTLLEIGLDGYIQRAKDSFGKLSEPKNVNFLKSVLIVLESFKLYIQRWEKAAMDEGREDLARILRAIAGDPPSSLHEAMQLVLLTHVVFKSECRNHMALGRMDQYLYPLYKNDIESGKLSRQDVLELFCHFWVKLEEIQEVQNICIGGLTPEGNDATNELSYICLEANANVRSPYTNLSARFHDNSPERYHEACIELIKTGIGFPAIFNDEVIIPGLTKIGIPITVARDYCLVGCIEIMLPGRQQAWSDGRFNMLLVLSNTIDALKTRSNLTFSKFKEEFVSLFKASIQDYVNKMNAKIQSYPTEYFSDPFLSALTRDCMARGLDINDGGALFPRFHGIAGMGLGSTTDSLMAINTLVFQEKKLSLQELAGILDQNFQDHDALRQYCINRSPKYGNHVEEVDKIAAWLVDLFTKECLAHHIPTGGSYVGLMAANIQNISAGKEVKATPDGRLAFTPLSDAASPMYNMDRNGPTAFLGSVSTPDYSNAFGGTVINMRFDPVVFKGKIGTERMKVFTSTFVEKRIPELQFNFTSNDVLAEALKEPQNHSNLVVRVSGFSAYFTTLDVEVQQDIMRRRIHGIGE
ncbi:MAG: pyruvate formate lyase family protein [Candidatus Hodarchaeota archaeon]